jgi:hypothetical protein
MEMYPFIKEGSINIFPERTMIIPKKSRWSLEVNYLYTQHIWNIKETERKGFPHETQ